MVDDVIGAPQIAVLVGLGGQGKTQIALALCRQCANDFGTIIWINASTRISALSDVKRPVKKLGIDTEQSQDGQATIALFHRWLRGLRSPWMLVFDNYDDPSSFRDISSFYLDSGVTVITSRHPSSKRLGTIFEVGAMTEAEGVEMLLRDISEHEKNSELQAPVRQVVARLGNLALAIDQAASYIASRQMPLQTFVKVFQSRKKAILAHIPAIWEYQTDDGQALPVFTTWELSVSQIASNDLDRASITNFLTLVAFLDASSVSEGRWDSATFQDLVMSLVDLALVQYIEYDEGYILISLRPVIKDWLQLRISSAAQERMVQDTVDLLAIYLTTNDATDLPYRTRAAALKHVDATELNVTRFLRTMDGLLAHGGYLQGQQAVFATFYGKQDRTTDAEALFIRVLQLQHQYQGPTHIEILATTNNLAGLYCRLQRYEEAETLLRTILEGKEKLFPPDDIRITNTINELGNVCSDLCRYEEVKTFYLRNLESLLNNLNPAPISLKIVYNNLGQLAMRQAEWEEAQEVFEKASALSKNTGLTGWSSESAAECGDLDQVDCQIVINTARLFRCVGLLDPAGIMYTKAAQALLALLGPKYSKYMAAQEEFIDLCDIRREVEDTARLRHSQNNDMDTGIKGARADRENAMVQNSMLRLEVEAEQLKTSNSTDLTLQGRSEGHGGSNSTLPMPQSSLLRPMQTSSMSRNNRPQQMLQCAFPFMTDGTTEAKGVGASCRHSNGSGQLLRSPREGSRGLIQGANCGQSMRVPPSRMDDSGTQRVNLYTPAQQSQLLASRRAYTERMLAIVNAQQPMCVEKSVRIEDGPGHSNIIS